MRYLQDQERFEYEQSKEADYRKKIRDMAFEVAHRDRFHVDEFDLRSMFKSCELEDVVGSYLKTLDHSHALEHITESPRASSLGHILADIMLGEFEKTEDLLAALSDGAVNVALEYVAKHVNDVLPHCIETVEDYRRNAANT